MHPKYPICSESQQANYKDSINCTKKKKNTHTTKLAKEKINKFLVRKQTNNINLLYNSTVLKCAFSNYLSIDCLRRYKLKLKRFRVKTTNLGEKKEKEKKKPLILLKNSTMLVIELLLKKILKIGIQHNQKASWQ